MSEAERSELMKAAGLIRKYGISACLKSSYFQKTILADGSTIDATTVFHSMLSECAVLAGELDELLIVDPFLFPNTADDGYLPTLVRMTCWTNLKSLVLICGTKWNKSLCDEFRESFEIFSQATVTVRATSVFHDRFWIFNRSIGLYCGTSLNGIGRKFALAERLSSEDVRDIVQRCDAIA